MTTATYQIPKILKFGELSYKQGNVRVRITDIKWGKYKDIDGNEVDFQRGNHEYLKISKNLRLCSVCSPDLCKDGYDSNMFTLYVWGRDTSDDSNSARRFGSDMMQYKVFQDIQKLAIDDEDTEIKEEKEPVVSQELEIEESNNPNF